jgi:hypothetical protein
MPEMKIAERARKAQREGKALTTAAGEFVREEMEHIRKGKHGARSPKQAIAIGLSKARRAGVALSPPKKGRTSRVRRQAERDIEKGKEPRRAASPRRSRATRNALKREGRRAASPQALSRQARRSRKKRAKSGAVTRGPRRQAGTRTSGRPSSRRAGTRSQKGSRRTASRRARSAD